MSIQVADSDTSALTKALGAYYQYLAMGNMIAEVQPTRWAEPFYSIPDIWGMVTTAVTPVYDKRQEPWTMFGVAAVDLPMCELTEAAAAAGWTDDVADPSEVLTRQGCACADSYTYEGRTYTGCTTYDWATAWCGTVDSDCGICDERMEGTTPLELLLAAHGQLDLLDLAVLDILEPGGLELVLFNLVLGRALPDANDLL